VNPLPAHIRLEPLEPDELDFLTQRYLTTARQFYALMRYLIVAVIFVPVSDFTNQQIWLCGQATTLGLFLLAYLTGYLHSIRPYQLELKQKQKIVETTIITEKKFMAINNTYHFYISEPMYSIEVEPDAYNQYDTNDEINVEYLPHTKIYLGYF
jgi:hypothetical protein